MKKNENTSAVVPAPYAVDNVQRFAVVNLGVATTFSAAAPPGTYFVQMRSLSACGASTPGPTATVVIP